MMDDVSAWRNRIEDMLLSLCRAGKPDISKEQQLANINLIKELTATWNDTLVQCD